MFLELARPFSFFFSLLSLYPVLMSAFFEPGSRWQERLAMAVLEIAFAACVCFASGFLFSRPSPASPQGEPLLSTLPVRLLLWALVGMGVLFVVSWYLEEYLVPFMRHDCCGHPLLMRT